MTHTEVRAHRLALPNEAATARLAAALAPMFLPGDVITLSGDLGAGKTSFARYAIRRLMGDPGMDVPSPTFSIMQVYDSPQGRIVHADLYRIADGAELEEIGWDEAGANAILLVEWPDRAGDNLSGQRLDLVFEIDPANPSGARHVTLNAHGNWPARIGRALEIAAFLETAGWGGARRQHLQGDASSRRYERLIDRGRSAILMDAPRRPDGPPIRDGKPYSRIAKLAEDVVPFAAIARGLKAEGFSAPDILAHDFRRGLLLVEDFGAQGVVVEGAHATERMETAVDLLAELHGRDLPRAIAVEDTVYSVPPYDLEALLIETELLLDWYLPHMGVTLAPEHRRRFLDLWMQVLTPVVEGPGTWTLRDYHSPNLMWLPEREGIRRIGLLDFQDTVIGHPAYDVVSLLQDARLDVPEGLEMALLTRYVKARRAKDPFFEPLAFAGAYAVLGAQRATKILGIFVRLANRDGKKNYLQHLPRLAQYLDRDLAHPALSELRNWYLAAVRPRR